MIRLIVWILEILKLFFKQFQTQLIMSIYHILKDQKSRNYRIKMRWSLSFHVSFHYFKKFGSTSYGTKFSYFALIWLEWMFLWSSCQLSLLVWNFHWKICLVILRGLRDAISSSFSGNCAIGCGDWDSSKLIRLRIKFVWGLFSLRLVDWWKELLFNWCWLSFK